MTDSRGALKQRAEKDGIEFFLAMFTEVNGKPCAKAVPVSEIDNLLTDGAGFAGFAAGGLGQSPAEGDIDAIPDPATYTPLPWRPEVAVLHCSPTAKGSPWPYGPRVILENLLRKLRDERGWVFKTGMEPEYFLLRRNGEGGLEYADAFDTSAKPCYDAKAVERSWPFLSKLSRYLNHLGWGNYANDSEDGNGQYETNIGYSDALTTADRIIFFRYMTHTLAHQEGLLATFMGKPFTNNTGSGLNTHFSLWTQQGEPLFLDEADSRGLGLSQTAYHFIGGVLEHALGISALICPTVNAYKRIGVPHPRSGSTWTPNHLTYGGNNRTVMLRVPEAGRVENRAVDGAANPYLATAAILAAGLDGVDRGLDPGEPLYERNTYTMSPEELAAFTPVPATLWDAVDALAEDKVIRAALGEGPSGDFVDFFAREKRDEFAEYHSQVSQWEIDRYLLT